jgi:hypothetical protein
MAANKHKNTAKHITAMSWKIMSCISPASNWSLHHDVALLWQPTNTESSKQTLRKVLEDHVVHLSRQSSTSTLQL